MILITYSFIATIVCVYLLSALKWFVRDTNIWNKAFFFKNALLYGKGSYVINSKQGNQGYNISFSNHSNTVVAEDIAHIFDRFYTTDKSYMTLENTRIIASLSPK